MSSIPQVQSPSILTTNTEALNTPLNKEEKSTFISYVMSAFSLTEEQAAALVDRLAPDQARTYMDLASGKTNITRDQAQKMWGLTDEETDAMFGQKNKIGIFDNPFGDLFLQFLMLSYSLGLDIKKIMSTVSNMKFDEAITAAKDRKDGAMKEFACAMAAATVTGMFAGGSFYKIYRMDAEKMNPHNQMLQWMSPVTAQLFSAPLTAGGQFGKAFDDFEASLHDANSQLLDTVFQQLMNTWQSSNDASRTYTSGL